MKQMALFETETSTHKQKKTVDMRGRFGPVLSALMEQGKNEQTARRVIGSWIKRAGGKSDDVLEAARSGIETEAVDLVAYVYGCLAKKSDSRSRHERTRSAAAAILAGR